jgi:uncharacterized protein (TIRG00374 family)
MKKYILLVLKIGISGGLIFLAAHNLDPRELLDQILKTDTGWLGLAFLLLSISYFLGAFQWRMILQMTRIEISYPRTLGYYYVGLFFNNFLISGMGGDLLRVYDIQKHASDQERYSPALATVFFDRFVGLLTLIFFACLAGAFVIGRGESSKMFASIAVMFMVWIMILIVLFNKRMAENTIKPLLQVLPAKIYERLSHLYEEIHQFRNQHKSLLRIFSVSVFVQSLRIFSIWAIGRAMGDRSPMIFYIIFVPIMSLAASLPISVGGTGPREQTSILLFKKIGVGAEVAFSIGFVSYIVSSLSTIPGAIIFLFRKSHANE